MGKSRSYIGKTVCEYEFIELIGKGTFSEVYKAYDNKLLRNVAIKAALPNLTGDGEDKEALFREAIIHARSEHSNIVPIYDVLDDKQTVFIVMRYLAGENLDQVINKDKKPLELRKALTIIQNILLGMEYAHSKGVIHLDLKPSNIFRTLSNEVLIMDFGIATLLEEQSLKKGKIFGTPPYMSPEHITCAYMDARSDIYSIGIMLYVMITGRLPFTSAKSVEDIFRCHLEEEPIKPSQFIPSIPESIDHVLLKSLKKKSRDRYHSCSEFSISLEKAVGKDTMAISDESDLRWFPRATVHLNAKIKVYENINYISAKIVNLSVGGASLQITSDIEIGSTIILIINLPINYTYTSIQIKATVLWKNTETREDINEIGVCFIKLKDIERYRIGLFVRDHLLKEDTQEI